MRPIRLIQAGLVIGAIAVVVAVALQIRGAATGEEVLVASHDGPGAPSPPPNADDDAPGAKGVTGEVMDGPNRRWSYRFERAEESERGVIADGVRIEAVAADGETYRLQATHAETSADRQFVRAEGDVRIDGEDLALRAGWAEHYGREAEASEVLGGEVNGRVGDRLLLSDRAEYRRLTETYRLDGDISVLDRGSKPTTMLHAQELQYRRVAATAMLKHSVFAVRGSVSVIDAHQVDIELTHGKPSRLVLQGKPFSGFLIEAWNPNACDEQVSLYRAWTPGLWVDNTSHATSLGPGSMMVRPYPDGGTLSVESMSASAQRLWSVTASDWTVTIDAHGRARAVTAAQTTWRKDPNDGAPEEQSWDALEVRAEIGPRGGVDLAEFPQGLQARRGPMLLTGKHANYRAGILRVDRSPRLTTATSTLEADSIDLSPDSGEIQASGNVRSRSRADHGGARSLLAQTPGQAVQAKAQAMATEGRGEWIVYRGSAQLWQGSDLLSADEIRADKSFATLKARGTVALRLQGKGGDVIEVFADLLDYDGDVAVLRGGVRLSGSEVRVRAEEAKLWFSAEGRELARIEAIGDPVVGEREPYRSYSRRLAHDQATGRTVLSGSDSQLARVVDRDGNETLGDEVTLWPGDRGIRVGSAGDGFSVSRVGAGGSKSP